MEFQELGLLGMLVVSCFGFVSMWFAVQGAWHLFRNRLAWSEAGAGWATMLLGIVIFAGGWIIFDVVWIAERAIRYTRRFVLKRSSSPA